MNNVDNINCTNNAGNINPQNNINSNGNVNTVNPANSINGQGQPVFRQTAPSIPEYNNTVPAYVPYIHSPLAEEPAVLDFREKMAKKLGGASLLYAAFSTFCLYDNLSGITMPFFGIVTLIYIVYCLRQFDVPIKKTSWFYGSMIMGLTISNFLTGNQSIIFFNNVGVICLLFIILLHNVYDDSKWTFSKTALSACESFSFSIMEISDFKKDMQVMKERRALQPVANNKQTVIRNVMIGLLISVPVVGILLALLSAADLVFSSILTKYFSFDINFGDIFGVAITFTFIFFAAYCTLRFFSKKSLNEEVTVNRNYEPLIAITVLSLVSVIYLLFSVIQIVYLFWGGVKLPENYTYAAYAREGFFQLLAVSIINFLMVLFVNNHFKESRVLKILMTIISLCTYIMIASSFMRMILYIDAYLLTTLRILVLWGLAVLALLFIAVIISIYKHDFPLFKYSIVVVGILYLMISFAHTDRIIADYNLTHMDDKTVVESTRRNTVTDYNYLKTLSTDAAPVIAKYDDPWANSYFKHCERYYNNRSLRQFNLSAYTAKMLSEYR